MSDLITFKNAQIKALQKEVYDLQVKNLQLATWVYELADEDTPKEYKREVLKERDNFMIDYITKNE
jgi:cell division protein FtsB